MELELHGCYICEKSFSSASNLNRHIRGIHNCETLKPGTIVCGLCNQDYTTTGKLQEHLANTHDINIETELFVFASDEEYREWKENEELRTASKFVKHTGGKVDNGKEIYYCHRSGKSRVSVGIESRKRSVKTQGSNKLGYHCPAKITTLKIVSDCIEVEYVRTHVGHTTDIRRVPLSHSERLTIAGKLAQNLSVDGILEDLRTLAVGEKLERIRLLTRQDLENIARDFKVSKDGVIHGNEAATVDEWVESMSENEENPVRCYKRRGEICNEHPNLDIDDFLLVITTQSQREMIAKHGDAIMVDITDGGLCDFELISIFVFDGNEDFPCCFILTNRMDEIGLKVGFESLQMVTGTISPNVFLSFDDAEMVFVAWEATFGFSGERLLCSWHVNRDWERKMMYIEGDEDVKQEVFKKLRGLLEETDRDVFQNMLGRVCKELLENEETSSFGTYFSAHYVNRPEMWARCYHPELGTDVILNIDNIHNVIKYENVNGIRVKRLDKTIHALMTFLYRWRRSDKSKVFDKVPVKKWNRTRVGPRKFKTLRQRHFKSLKMSADEVFVVGDEEWEVLSIGEELHRVSSLNKCSEICSIYCVDCEACVHNFKCTCSDYAIRRNMCVHIHLVCRTQLVKREAEVESCDLSNGTDGGVDSDEMAYEVGAVKEEEVEVEVEVGAGGEEDLEVQKATGMEELQGAMRECLDSCVTEVELKQMLEYFNHCKENWLTSRHVEGKATKQVVLLFI